MRLLCAFALCFVFIYKTNAVVTNCDSGPTIIGTVSNVIVQNPIVVSQPFTVNGLVNINRRVGSAELTAAELVLESAALTIAGRSIPVCVNGRLNNVKNSRQCIFNFCRVVGVDVCKKIAAQGPQVIEIKDQKFSFLTSFANQFGYLSAFGQIPITIKAKVVLGGVEVGCVSVSDVNIQFDAPTHGRKRRQPGKRGPPKVFADLWSPGVSGVRGGPPKFTSNIRRYGNAPPPRGPPKIVSDIRRRYGKGPGPGGRGPPKVMSPGEVGA